MAAAALVLASAIVVLALAAALVRAIPQNRRSKV